MFLNQALNAPLCSIKLMLMLATCSNNVLFISNCQRRLTSSRGTILGGAELVDERDGDAGEAEHADEDHVEGLGGDVAHEGVVEPGHEGAHGEDGDAGVVELAEEVGDGQRVAAEGVVGGGEEEAEDGAEEEGADRHVVVVLFVRRCVRVHADAHENEATFSQRRNVFVPVHFF